MIQLSDFRRSEPFRGAVFDFNGTLFWDTSEHNQSWVVCMSEFGVKVTPELLFSRFHGKPNDAIICGLLGEETSDETVRKVTARKESVYQECCLARKTPLHLAPGAEELLNWLKENQVPFTVATSAPVENVDFYFRVLNIGRWFQREKIVYFDGTFPGKPNPAFYQRAMGKIGCTPEETVIFEDAPSGILAAENAGCKNIVCVDSEHSDYSSYSYPVLRDFSEVNRSIFK